MDTKERFGMLSVDVGFVVDVVGHAHMCVHVAECKVCVPQA